MQTILYEVRNSLYINITNRCPCACTFCIRQNGEGVYGSDSLWLEREPSVGEVIAALDAVDVSEYEEAVFCGYGEPMERAEDVAVIGRHIKDSLNLPVRINTNGLGDMINGRPVAALLAGAIDTVSVSLNQYNSEKYNAVTCPEWGGAFEAMLKFAEDCKKYVKEVIFTVVNIIPAEDIAECEKLAAKMGIPLRVRGYD